MKNVLIELPYEGDHCIPCVYMLETIEEAMIGLGELVKLELLYLRQKEGGLRYLALSEKIGRPAPIPSVFIDGELVFDHTPQVDELRNLLCAALTKGD